ncbi:MAG: hypothetical protein NTZ64_07150 [Polaromonas sp.]|nr:hypothetical protein [Polaromonas sp.]
MPALFHPLIRLQMLARLLLAGLLTALLASAHAQNGYSPAAPLDPPARVAWLGLAEGEVSFAPADADGANGSGEPGDWQPALLNRPLVAGDRLWSGARARTELHIGSTAVRMAPETGLDFVALDDNRLQLRLAQGTCLTASAWKLTRPTWPSSSPSRATTGSTWTRPATPAAWWPSRAAAGSTATTASRCPSTAASRPASAAPA